MEAIVTNRRVVCPHGNVMELRIESNLTETGMATKVTQQVCRACLLAVAPGYALSSLPPPAKEQP